MNSAATTHTTVTTIDSTKPNTKQELIAANIKLLIEQLEAGRSDALTNYLTAMSRFHNYSFGNVLEIARQMPTATRVAGFWTWKNLGRSVKAGSKGIRILAPIVGVRRKKGEEANKDITNQNERVLLGFRNAYILERLSRDLWPSLCALDVIRECHFSKSLDSSSHIIAQLIYPAQHSPMRGWFSSLPSGLKPTRQHARICSAAAMFRTVA